MKQRTALGVIAVILVIGGLSLAVMHKDNHAAMNASSNTAATTDTGTSGDGTTANMGGTTGTGTTGTGTNGTNGAAGTTTTP